MDSVRSGPYGQIFRPDNFVFGQVCRLCVFSAMSVSCFNLAGSWPSFRLLQVYQSCSGPCNHLSPKSLFPGSIWKICFQATKAGVCSVADRSRK